MTKEELEFRVRTALKLTDVLKVLPQAKAVRGNLTDIGRVLEGEGLYSGPGATENGRKEGVANE